MGISVSLILIAVGAILTWAVTATVSGIDINVVGVILMIVGAAGLDPLDAVLVELGWLPQHAHRHDHRPRRRYAPALISASIEEADGAGAMPAPYCCEGTMDSVTSIETVGDAHVVTLHGEIDAFTAPSLRDDLRASGRGDGCPQRRRRPRGGHASSTRRRSARSSASSGGCGSETGSCGSCSRAPQPSRIFELTGLDAVLDLYPDRAAALSAASA